MSDDKKKAIKNFFRSVGVALFALIQLILLGAGTLFDKQDIDFYLGGKVFDSKLLIYLWLAVNLSGMLHLYITRKNEKGKQNYVAVIVSAVMLMASFWLVADNAIDCFKHNKVSANIVLSGEKEVFLQEYEDKEKYNSIYVYQIQHKHLAKKLGSIDERYFSNNCLQQNEYAHEYDEQSNKLDIVCAYGTFGGEHIMLEPDYDNGSLRYTFELE